jgi:hypothetical protein
MVAEANVIVHGRVTSVVPQWAAGRRRIESLVTVEVETTLKGEARAAITVVTQGGELGSYRSVMVGAPVLAPGDEIVVFLKAQPPSLPHIIGLNQGVFRVVTPAGSDVKHVVPPVVMSGQGPNGKVVRGDWSRRPLTASQFASEVLRVLDEVTVRQVPEVRE